MLFTYLIKYHEKLFRVCFQFFFISYFFISSFDTLYANLGLGQKYMSCGVDFGQKHLKTKVGFHFEKLQ